MSEWNSPTQARIIARGLVLWGLDDEAGANTERQKTAARI